MFKPRSGADIEYPCALVVPRLKVNRGVLADLKSGAFLEKGQEAFEKTRLLLNSGSSNEQSYKTGQEEEKSTSTSQDQTNENSSLSFVGTPILPLVVSALEKVGLIVQIKPLLSSGDDVTCDILIVRAEIDSIRDFAQAIGYPCKIDKENLRKRAEKTGTYFGGNAEKGESKAKVRGMRGRLLAHFISTDPRTMDKGARNPYAFLHAPYSKVLDALFVQYAGNAVSSPFSKLDIVKLTYRMIIEAIAKDKDIYTHWLENSPQIVTMAKPWAGIDSLLYDGLLLSCFCLHLDSSDGLIASGKHTKGGEDDEIVTRDSLVNQLTGFNFNSTNKVWTRNYERIVENDLANYFGSAIAFYFCFLSHYTRWLLFLAYSGIIFALGQRLFPRFELFWLVLIALFFTVWVFSMLRTWKEREARLGLRWGGLIHETQITMSSKKGLQRANFYGIKNMINPVTGTTDVPYFPQRKRRVLQRQSWALIFLCLCVALMNLIICKALRVILIAHGYPALPSTVINAIFVFILNNAVLGIATKLADRENHKHDHEYEAAIFIYVVIFRIINSFATLFYTAYLKRRLEGSCDKHDDCFKDAGHTTAIFFIVQLTVGNALEILPAIIKLNKVKKFVRQKEEQNKSTELTLPKNHQNNKYENDDEYAIARDALRAEHQFSLADTPAIDVLDDYLEIVIQFGYITLFFVTFPVAPIFAFFSNILEAKIDAIKRLAKRRPVPTDQSDISAYFNAFLFLAFAALINNTALIVFQTHLVPSSPDLFVKIIVVLSALAYFIFTFNLSGAQKSHLPYDVSLQLERQAFVLSPESKLVPELFSSQKSSSIFSSSPTTFISNLVTTPK